MCAHAICKWWMYADVCVCVRVVSVISRKAWTGLCDGVLTTSHCSYKVATLAKTEDFLPFLFAEKNTKYTSEMRHGTTKKMSFENLADLGSEHLWDRSFRFLQTLRLFTDIYGIYPSVYPWLNRWGYMEPSRQTVPHHHTSPTPGAPGSKTQAYGRGQSWVGRAITHLGCPTLW